jgi:hypothetical protein
MGSPMKINLYPRRSRRMVKETYEVITDKKSFASFFFEIDIEWDEVVEDLTVKHIQ